MLILLSGHTGFTVKPDVHVALIATAYLPCGAVSSIFSALPTLKLAGLFRGGYRALSLAEFNGLNYTLFSGLGHHSDQSGFPFASVIQTGWLAPCM